MNIMGKAVLTKEQMIQYIKNTKVSPKLNTSIENLIDLFLLEGEKEGVRGDIAFVQATWETNNFIFNGDVNWKQNNYSGLGATGGVPGNSFPTPQIGVRAQIQHLKGYASKDNLNQPCVDDRFKYLTNKRGSAPTVMSLAGTWAADKNYGVELTKRYNTIAKIKIDPPKVQNEFKITDGFLVAQPINMTEENKKLFHAALEYFVNGVSNFLVVGKDFNKYKDAQSIIIIDSENSERPGAPSIQFLVKNMKDVETLVKGQSHWSRLRKENYNDGN